MRTLAMTGTLVLAGLLVSGSGRAAENWCLRNFGDPPDKRCVSAPLDYCLRGLAAGGGVCGRERGGAREVSEDRARPQRDGRRGERKDRWNW
jgi:hypothetical protein